MKIKTLIKPVALGATLVTITNFVSPKYTEIAAVGAGLYILYSIVTYKEDTPAAINIKYDKASNKVIADIKNPSDTTYAFLAQIRLRETMKQPQEGMMNGAAMTDKTTLIGESDMPVVIGPNEMMSIELPLMIPQEMYESTDGSLNIKLTFHDVQQAIEEITKKKIEQKITHIEDKIEPITIVPVVPKVDTTEIAPTIQTTIEPPEGIPRLPTPLEVLNSPFPEYETLISIVPENLHKAEELIKNFKEEDAPIVSPKSVFIPMNDERTGRGIGHSQTMLHIIASIDRLKKLNLGNDAI
jgi:hypothetical protein